MNLAVVGVDCLVRGTMREIDIFSPPALQAHPDPPMKRGNLYFSFHERTEWFSKHENNESN